jgi:hypothetical protein
MNYTPPASDDLQLLKTELHLTGKQMAALACVGEQHWRNYIGGADPKPMPYPNLFHLAAQVALSTSDLEKVYAHMRQIGAVVDQGNKS